MDVTRRTLLASAGAASIGTLLASCAGFTGQPSGGGGNGSGSTTLTFATWASDTEKSAYQKLIKKFEQANKGVTVRANYQPYSQFFTNIDAQLSAGNAPDVFRLGYGQIGGYAAQGQLLDLSSSVGGDRDDYIPAFIEAVSYEDKVFGVPQQTDTSAVIYNKSLMSDAGIDSLPDSLDNAWSFDEFDDVLSTLRDALPAKQFPFAYNWQLAGATRWLSWLFSTGGRLLNQDLNKSAIVSAEGTRALDYTKAFFEKKYVPTNSSTKSNAYADTTWLAGTTAMVSAGNFLIPSFADARFEWGVTYLPQDQRGADDLGGNALVASQASKNADLATEFLQFMGGEEAMGEFCGEALELPTRKNLVDQDLGWDAPDGVIPVFVDQATTITADDAAQLTVPQATAINTVLQDQLEAAFRQGKSTEQTLADIAAGVDKAVA